MNGKRYPADTGGAIDVRAGELGIQCKYKQRLSHKELHTILLGLSREDDLLPCVVHAFPPGKGGKSEDMITFLLKDYLS